MLLVSGMLGAVPASGRPLGEAWIRVEAGELRRLSEIPGVGIAEDRRDGEVRVLVEPGAIERLRTAGWSVSGVRADHRSAPPVGYHTPAEGSLLLHDLVERSTRAGFVNLGTSLEGRPIDGLWIGRPPDEGAPMYRILGGHHGDEVISVEVALAVAERLVGDDGREPAITALLDRATVWIVPYVNPDGVVSGSRVNAAGIDLNRNYDVEWDAGTLRAGPYPFSEPETRAVRAFGTFERPVASLSLHAGAANLGWPWNYTTERPTDDDALLLLAGIYERACDAPRFWTTQGADWYLTFGDTNDWAYGHYGVLDFTLELSEVRAPPVEELSRVIGWHLDAILAFLDQAPTLSGVVVDGDGNPVEARLVLDGLTRPFLSDPSTGAFHRIVAPGPATLSVEAEGYTPVVVDIAIGTDDPVTVVLDAVALARTVVEPAVVWEPRLVSLARSGPVTLSRPDADPVVREAPGGALFVDPAELAPGWWTITLPDGTVWPRALFVEAAEAVIVDDWRIDGDTLRIDGSGFAPGARAWAVWGVARVPSPLPVLHVAPDVLELDLSGVPGDERVDLGLWTSGGIVGLSDVRSGGTRGSFDDEELIAVSACACRASARHVSGPPLSELGWMFTAALIAVRRRRRDLAQHPPRL